MASLPTPGSSDVWGANLNAAIESLHLGPDTHANRPTTGLTKGTLYSCTDHKLIYRWSGSAWATYATVGDDTAASTTFTPTGNIAATNVQAALAELDSEKVNKSGDTFTAATAASTPLIVSAAASQSANLTEWRGSNGVPVTAIRASGRLQVNGQSAVQFSGDLGGSFTPSGASAQSIILIIDGVQYKLPIYPV